MGSEGVLREPHVRYIEVEKNCLRVLCIQFAKNNFRTSTAQLFRPFGSEDPRLKVALVTHEPLIHFGLNCGAKSCPPIKTFSAAVKRPEPHSSSFPLLSRFAAVLQNITEELTLACKAFLETEDAVAVDKNRKTVSLSKIFDWYREDFGKNNKEVNLSPLPLDAR